MGAEMSDRCRDGAKEGFKHPVLLLFVECSRRCGVDVEAYHGSCNVGKCDFDATGYSVSSLVTCRRCLCELKTRAEQVSSKSSLAGASPHHALTPSHSGRKRHYLR